MNYPLVKDTLDLLQRFEEENSSKTEFSEDIDGFIEWVIHSFRDASLDTEPEWEGKEKGRGAESVINTLIVHMNRYAKSYSRSAIHGTDFSTQEDFIYLINLKAHGPMSKMELIKKNVHDKPAGMQVINRLIAQKWVDQKDSLTDRRSKIISISKKGKDALDRQMDKIRHATKIVTGDLTHPEKMLLIRLLMKLNDFHQPIYDKNIEPEYLLERVMNDAGQ